MAFIPKDAKWYLAGIVEQLSVEGDPRHVVHINTVLVRAGSPEEAYTEALLLGANSNNTYANPEGKTVTIRFLGLHDLNVIHDELEHGAELSYRKFMTTDESTIREWVSTKEDLGVFAPMRLKEGPDYTSKEVMDEVHKILGQPPPGTDPAIN